MVVLGTDRAPRTALSPPFPSTSSFWWCGRLFFRHRPRPAPFPSLVPRRPSRVTGRSEEDDPIDPDARVVVVVVVRRRKSGVGGGFCCCNSRSLNITDSGMPRMCRSFPASGKQNASHTASLSSSFSLFLFFFSSARFVSEGGVDVGRPISHSFSFSSSSWGGTTATIACDSVAALGRAEVPPFSSTSSSPSSFGGWPLFSVQ